MITYRDHPKKTLWVRKKLYGDGGKVFFGRTCLKIVFEAKERGNRGRQEKEGKTHGGAEGPQKVAIYFLGQEQRCIEDGFPFTTLHAAISASSAPKSLRLFGDTFAAKSDFEIGSKLLEGIRPGQEDLIVFPCPSRIPRRRLSADALKIGSARPLRTATLRSACVNCRRRARGRCLERWRALRQGPAHWMAPPEPVHWTARREALFSYTRPC